jgi:hypothetical protein
LNQSWTSLNSIICIVWVIFKYLVSICQIAKLSSRHRMEQRVFLFISLIIEGTTEKVLQFIMPLRSIYNQNIGFIEQILYFWAPLKGSNNKGSINWHYFCHEHIFLVTFSELPPISLCQYYTKMRCSIYKQKSFATSLAKLCNHKNESFQKSVL